MGGMKKCECPRETEQSLRQRKRQRDGETHVHIHTDTGVGGGAGREQGLISVPLPQADITHFISGQYETGS